VFSFPLLRAMGCASSSVPQSDISEDHSARKSAPQPVISEDPSFPKLLGQDVSSGIDKELLRLELTPLDLAMYTITGPVASMTLVAGWTEGMTAQLKAAIAKLVEQKPILAGTIRKRAEDEVPFVEAGVHKDFVFEIAGPEDFVVPRNTTDAIAMLQSWEAMFAEKSIGRFEQIVETEGPLFRVILMKLPSAHMAYVVEVNHMIADGASYYKIIDFINCAINARPLPELLWEAAPETVMIPDVYSQEDKDLALTGWLPAFMEKFALYAPGTNSARVVDVRVVDNDAVAAMKQEYLPSARAEGFDFVSTNDLIMAGLMELTDEGANGNMLANMRDRMPGITNNVMGNFERLVGFPASAAAANPVFFRSLNKTFVHWGSESNPQLSSEGGPKEAQVACNFATVTNWASLTHFIEPEGACVLGHCALSSFVTDVAGFDLSVVLKVDSKGTLAVMSNHLAGKRYEEIQERVSNSKVFQHLFLKKPDAKSGEFASC